METRKKFIEKRKHLFWYVKDPTKVSDEALVEAVLNLGDWDDVQKLIKLLGIRKVASVFKKETNRKRVNYGEKTVNLFNLYFLRHA
jgi:adenylate cyclase class IV